MPFTLSTIKPYLSGLTLFALLSGLFAGILLQGRTTSRVLDEAELLREIERGQHMPVIVQSPELTLAAGDAEKIRDAINNADPIRLMRTTIEIPDAYASAMFDCTLGGNEPWFTGELVAKSEAFSPQHGAEQDVHLAAQFRASGTLYKCAEGGHRVLVATGIGISGPLHPFSLVQVSKVTAWASYTGFAANLYLTFLLMLFLPTLAISLVRAIVDSAGSAKAFGYVFWFFLWSSLLGATLGTATACIARATKIVPFTMDAADLEVMARSVGGPASSSDYDPHPVLTQIGRIIPTNPLGALTDASGNSGLQVAFMAVVIGMILMALRVETRARISEQLKKILALVISSRDLKWTALSDYADAFAPLGVLFFTMTAFASADFRLLTDLADLTAVAVVALLLHVICIFLWLKLFRNPGEWLTKAFVPSLPGLLTAFATASSYAALPAVSNVPLLQQDESKRGVFDLGTTLNKNGTSVYLAAAAAFIFLHYHPSIDGTHFVEIVLLSTLAGTVIAGLPFAAIVGLRMILVAASLPGGLAWLLLPIDPVADRLVTPVNVLCNLAGASTRRERRTIVSIRVDPATPPPKAIA